MSDTFDHEGDAWVSLEDDYQPRYSGLKRRFQNYHAADKTPQTPRHGELWTAAEAQNLRSMFQKGQQINIIAKTLGRKESAIIARLENLGLVNLSTANPVKKERTFVNLNHIITLLQKDYTTVNVAFQAPARSGSSNQIYTYKISDKAREGLNVGDQLVVPARGELKVVWVAEIHDTPQIDVKAPYALQWVVCRVDRAAYDDQLKREREALKLLEKQERTKAQEEAAKAFLETVGDPAQFLALINGPSDANASS